VIQVDTQDMQVQYTSTDPITPEGGTAAVQGRTHNLLNQVTAFGVSPTSPPVLYDHGNNTGTSYPNRGNGNIINDGTRVNAFDPLNRLITVNLAVGGALIATYAYDALGRRIKKAVSNGGVTGTVPNGTSRYLLDGQQIVEELAGISGSTVILLCASIHLEPSRPRPR
jgi:YD repeat-containing protein